MTKTEIQKREEIVDKVDETIEVICEKVKNSRTRVSEDAEIVKALASLLEARAKILF